MDPRSDGFYVVWLYWARRYMSAKIRSRDSLPALLKELQRGYSLEVLDNASQVPVRVSGIKEQKGSQKWPIYVIDPQREISTMETLLKQEQEQLKGELFSYYLNIKNVFVIYSNDWECSENPSSREDEHNHDNISEGNQGHKSALKAQAHDNKTEGNKSRPEGNSLSIMNKIFTRFEDESSECRNESIIEAPHHKIEELQVLDKMAEVEGLEIWNCKYKHIPHSYVKVKNEEWKDCLTLPLLHPSQPKPINNHLILNRIEPLRPGIDKLLPFVSYLKLLDKYFPGFMPVIGSIFEINGLPLVFAKEEGGWSSESNVGVLCYYVVNGEDVPLSPALVQKWAQANSQTLLGRTIKQLGKRQRQKKRTKKQLQSKALILFEGDADGHHIW